MPKSNYQLLLLLFLLFSNHHSSSTSSPKTLNYSVLGEDANQSCNDGQFCNNTFCNGITIPYPFTVAGFRKLPLIPGFNITCQQSNTYLQTSSPRLSPSTAFFSGELPILNFSLDDASISVALSPSSFHCNRAFDREASKLPDLRNSPFTYSVARNVFTVIGCDSFVSLLPQGNNSSRAKRSCVSFCESVESVVDGVCSGVGCCQASIPEKLKSFELDFLSIRNMTGARVNNTPCGMAFILEQEAFKFSQEYLNFNEDSFSRRSVVLDWSIGDKSCEEVRRSGGRHICGEKAFCSNSSNGVGYLCRCNDGYHGNPYLPDGCQDIDECGVNGGPCVWKCKNSEGDYSCACPFGKTGDGKITGSGCKRVIPAEIGLAAGLCLLVLLFAGGLLFYGKLKIRKAAKLKQKNFMQNGGLLLEQHFSVKEAAAMIFTADELETATDNFSENRVLGHGGYGTVYKGILSGGREVAIKRSKLVDQTQIEQFINEVVILSQTNHRNVVKLLGCCLETQVPLLVYEFISNGTLSDHIHADSKLKTPHLSWEVRLRIAGETAEALAYLHEAASKPIIHRDVKSTNILLDEELTAKVSDFGASRLVPYNQTHVTTVVQGTLGYLDPEYFHTGLLSEKSDVYSFGVVLVELLTAENPVCFHKSEEERNLASFFVQLVKENRIVEMVDRRVAEEECPMSLSAVADLARRCLSVSGENRPTMKEVAVELNALKKLLLMGRLPESIGGKDQRRCFVRPPNVCRDNSEHSMEVKLL